MSEVYKNITHALKFCTAHTWRLHLLINWAGPNENKLQQLSNVMFNLIISWANAGLQHFWMAMTCNSFDNHTVKKGLYQPLTDAAKLLLVWGVHGVSSVVVVWTIVAGDSSSPFWVSGTDSGCRHSATTAVLSVSSAFGGVDGEGFLLACSKPKIMAVSCPPPLSVRWVSDSTLAEPSKDWTVARTFFNSRLLNSFCTSSGHSAGKCSLPKKRILLGMCVMHCATHSKATYALAEIIEKQQQAFFVTSEGAASDLKGKLSQVHGDGQDPGKWNVLSVAIICIDDTHLILTNLQDHCSVP